MVSQDRPERADLFLLFRGCLLRPGLLPRFLAATLHRLPFFVLVPHPPRFVILKAQRGIPLFVAQPFLAVLFALPV